jgi:hypothetical protein
MTEIEKLRELLAEARGWVAPGSAVRARIDAALAEPVQSEADRLLTELGKAPPCVSGRPGNTSTCGCDPCKEVFRLLDRITTARTKDAINAQRELAEARAEIDVLKAKVAQGTYVNSAFYGAAEYDLGRKTPASEEARDVWAGIVDKPHWALPALQRILSERDEAYEAGADMMRKYVAEWVQMHEEKGLPIGSAAIAHIPIPARKP